MQDTRRRRAFPQPPYERDVTARRVEFVRVRSPVRTPAPRVPAMFRFLLAASAAVVITSAATAQTEAPVAVYQSPTHPSTTVIEYPTRTVFTSQPPAGYPRPAVGLAAVSSPFYYGAELSIGGPGYAYHAYPPYNGWSSGYRGAYYGEPVPGARVGWRRR